MLNYIEYLNIPTKVAFTIVGIFLVLQILGELLESKGKIVPELLKIRKYFSRKSQEKKETEKTLKEAKVVLEEVNKHYSDDNITKRNEWMKCVNDRAIIYDESIVKINDELKNVTKALENNTKVTEEVFVQNSRDRIIDFASKVARKDSIVSREEFNRIFKVYQKYEEFLKEHDLTNGEVDISYDIIKESYEDRMKNHAFAEDVYKYNI